MGGQRFAVWTGAGRSPRCCGHGDAGSSAERVAVGRACASCDARDTLGPAVVSFTSRGGIPEGSCAALAGGSFPLTGRMIDKAIAVPIGRVVATELKPATPHQFHFWTPTDTTIGIGAIIKVGGGGTGEEGRVVYGVVTEGFAYSDLATPLHDVVGAEGDPARVEAPTARQQIRYWTAAVLRHTPEEPLQPVPLGQVYVADDADVAQALRMDTYLNSPAHKGRIAAVCFNVKGPDLCFLDQPGDLSDADRQRYERLGVPSTPFAQVRLYAPHKADGVNLNTLRTHPDLIGDVEPLTWGLQEVVDYAEVLLNRDDIDAKADAFIDFLRDRVLGRTFDDGFGTTHRVQTFADLDRLFRSIFDGLEMA